MGKELFGLVVAVVVMMIVMRLLFSELDGKNAVRRMNLAYFLNFEKKIYIYKNEINSNHYGDLFSVV